MTKTDNPADAGRHVFERAGLGVAPFRCVGFSESYITHPDGTTQAGSSCQYCSTGIRYLCHILSADGKRFHVGTDCVAKTGDAGLIRQYKNRPEVRAAAKAKRDAKGDAVIAEWNALISDPVNRNKLSALPSDNSYSKNLLESLEWIWARCGAAGRNRYLKALKARLAEIAVITIVTHHVTITPSVTLG